MLAFAPPLSHTPSADSHASSTLIRQRSTHRPSSHPTSSSSSVNPSTSSTHSSRSSKHTPKSLSSTRPSLEHRRADPSSTRTAEKPSTGERNIPSPSHPENHAPSEPPSSKPRGIPPPLEKIHEQDPNKLLRLLASLLQQIASANDQLRSTQTPTTADSVSHSEGGHVHRPPIWNTLLSASRESYSTPSSCLTFHARNIPTISLEAYLLRILKYCPTTNEVFLSLLVYFDRMSKLAFEVTGRAFAIDSYNVHRLVIAGITVASKFFSDVFYTNSRYAKVGGLPQNELNQLELQFLLLNDFRLAIPLDEMQRYAEQLQIYAQNTEAGIDIMPTPSQTQSPQDMIATSMRRMGAADAYGGRLPGEPMSEGDAIRETYSGVVGYHNALEMERRASETNGITTHSEIAARKNGVEAEEEDGTETDDEPTIRGHSSAGSETQSLCTVDSEDRYPEPDSEHESGSRTPERGAVMSP
ncbi:hypothetical protein M422DRAFT_22967 [Sphaerobolus stellatus SS14]|nr:hypothetical protein M422DRAFT_22967 [Sphaerobolus stellatus SS14]